MENHNGVSDTLQKGREYPPADEIGYVTQMISQLKEQLRYLYPEGEVFRQAHPKMHGLVKARFIIEPDLDEKYRKGVFAITREFDAFIRFSNASTHHAPDKKKDVRGMAIKLVGVEGEKLLSDKQDAKTQDFVLISPEAFMASDVKQFSRTIKAVTSSSKLAMLFFALNPMNWGVLFRTIKAFKSFGSIVEIPYFSTTPYQFGNPDLAVKYMAVPVNPENTPIAAKPHDDYLRYQLNDVLSRKEIKFDFCVQFQEDATKMPIEDATVKWTSKPVKLATIIIPMQTFDTDAQNEYGTNMSFNPWHSLPDHRPLGGLNRARKLVYESLSRFRHERNDEKEFEPENLNIPEF